MKKPTIIDVAANARVSIKTVSRVLNGEPNVAARTREQVLAAAAALDYRPNPFARGLRSTRSLLVAHLYDNPNPEYVLDVHAGLYAACRAHGYYLLPEPFSLADDGWPTTLQAFLAATRADGVVLTPPLCDDRALIDALLTAGVPTVRISPAQHDALTPLMFIDERRAAAVMTRHLIGLGHARIAFIAGPPAHGSAAQRRLGYRDALASAGLALEPSLERDGDFSFRTGRDRAGDLLGLPVRPTAIFCANDEMAAGALSAAASLGLRAPEDVSIAGFDDARISTVVWPQITTIRQPVRAMAETAGALIMAGAAAAFGDGAGTAACVQEFGFDLIVRDSTDRAPLVAARI